MAMAKQSKRRKPQVTAPLVQDPTSMFFGRTLEAVQTTVQGMYDKEFGQSFLPELLHPTMPEDIFRLANQLMVKVAELAAPFSAMMELSGTPCKEGCSYCCNQLVRSFIYEGVVLSEDIRLLPSVQRRTLEETATEMWARLVDQRYFERVLDMPTWEELGLLRLWHSRHATCPLLQNQRCSVYGYRPARCMFHYVMEDTSAKCACNPVTAVAYNSEPVQLFQTMATRCFDQRVLGFKAPLVSIPFINATLIGVRLLRDGVAETMAWLGLTEKRVC